jgi:hypothetical protein
VVSDVRANPLTLSRAVDSCLLLRKDDVRTHVRKEPWLPRLQCGKLRNCEYTWQVQFKANETLRGLHEGDRCQRGKGANHLEKAVALIVEVRR